MMKFEFKELGEVEKVTFEDLPLGMFKRVEMQGLTIGYKFGSSAVLFQREDILFVTNISGGHKKIFIHIPDSKIIVQELPKGTPQ